MDALAYAVPNGGLPASLKVTWSGTIGSNTPGATVAWKWEAEDTGTFTAATSYNSLGVKASLCNACGLASSNKDEAGTPEAFYNGAHAGGTGDGDSDENDWTSPATVTPGAVSSSQKAQTIAFPAIPAGQVCSPSTLLVNLSATSSSGLPIYYVVSGAAVLNNDDISLTLTGAGTVTVTASQPGNATYAAATPVTQTFTVASPPTPH